MMDQGIHLVIDGERAWQGMAQVLGLKMAPLPSNLIDCPGRAELHIYIGMQSLDSLV
jgi:hypothetical protein